MFSLDDHDLDADQRAAINESGDVFVVACPGSGKTRTLTFKIARELEKITSSKDFVVAITYTHRAADEIVERIERLGIDTTQLWVGTIHAFCLEWILKPYGIYHAELQHGFKILDNHEREATLTELCKPYKRFKVSFWDCDYHCTKDGYVLSCAQGKQPYVADVLKQYFQILSKNRQIDFELLLYYANVLLTTQPAISVLLSKLFRFVLIDEYQDTKQIQYSIISSIIRAGAGSTKLFVVGDPNQAIYGSLGGYAITPADFGAMAGVAFKQLPLLRNYRSSRRIIDYFTNYAVLPATIMCASEHEHYASTVTFNSTVAKGGIEDELVRLIRYNIEVAGIQPDEVCVLAPQWVHLASMTRKLMARLPQYQFDGPGMVPFSKDPENFWFKVSRIALTKASPQMFVTRFRWAAEVLRELRDAGADISRLSQRSFLRECNSISLAETDGLTYLREFFAELFSRIAIDFSALPALLDHHGAFFSSSQARIDRLTKEGSQFISDIENFRKVFAPRSGITISTIHGVKGAEYDAVIAYALLDGMVPHFSDPDGEESAMKLLYVICSRARKNLHLISETGRVNGIGEEYQPTPQLVTHVFDYN